MITVPPRHYCVIENPVLRQENKEVVKDKSGQAKLAHADLEIRLTQEPFPLYYGELLRTAPTPLRIVPADSALRLKAVLDFEDDTGEKQVAGDEWLFEGPGTYIPRKEVTVEETIRATTIRPNQALKLRARRETLDREGKLRVTGEEWLVSKVGAYLPGAYEEVVELVNAHVLTEKKALHVRATKTFKDQFGVVRKNGEEWLVRMADAETYIPDVYEEVVDVVNITTLNNRQYCVIQNPVDTSGKPQLGKRKLVKGELSFFLRPGESLERGIQDIFVLTETEGLILRANEAFKDQDSGVDRQPGDKWMIRGPTEYVPSVEVTVVARRSAIPLDENEGIYVRDMKSGRVRAVIGETYLLTQNEELWEKTLPYQTESLLFNYNTNPEPEKRTSFGEFSFGGNTSSSGLFGGDSGAPPFGFGTTQQQLLPEIQRWAPVCRSGTNSNRSSSLFQTAGAPAFGALQQQALFHAGRNVEQENQIRVDSGIASFGCTNINGPSAIRTQQDEEMWSKDLPAPVETLLSSGRDPLADRSDRKETQGKEITGQKRDKTKVVAFRVPHNAAIQVYDYKEKKARHFETGAKTEEIAAKLFSVPDFIGDSCKAIASRVRGMVAQVQFDDFHKNSARIIRTAVFGLDEAGKVKSRFEFAQNNLVITSVDIQSVEPVDQRTRDSLQKSVQLAIEITTNSQEAAARHEAERLEQEAKGRLERQKITDEAQAEKARKELLELQAASAAVESTGQAKAEAQSRAEAAKIEGEAAVEQAGLKAEASKIETEAELSRLVAAREAELKYMTEKAQLEVSKAKDMTAIETNKFSDMVNALGAQTIQAIATAGPEMQVKLLKSLGLKSTLITDGTTPINLFNTARGLVGSMGDHLGPAPLLDHQPKPSQDDQE